jgi:hypothetical protein
VNKGEPNCNNNNNYYYYYGYIFLGGKENFGAWRSGPIAPM